ncbi:AAA family ATPase [Microcoleus sp. Aus8_D3]|uniref:AAA family ATPase n=1 Tax=Microcoleus sp. Aus8_D3 TaxID=2818633 RepID=UPI002FD032D9
MADADQDHLTRAALMGAFDPRSLLGTGATADPSRLRALAAASTEVPVTVRTPFSPDAPVEVRWLWRLTPDGQRSGLAALPKGKARADLLASLPPTGGDAMAEALRLVLRGGKRAPAIARRTAKPRAEDLPELLRLMQAVELLRSAGVALEGWAAAEDLPKWLSRVAVRADKRAASAQILPWKLHGRRKELAALRQFAVEGEVRTPPFDRVEVNQTPAPGAPPTVILSGLGGSGKSALLEALRRRLARDRSILQVTFDLDQPSLRAGHRVALTQELLRQIGQARPDLEDRLSQVRQTLRGGVATTAAGVDPSREASAVHASLTDLNRQLSEEGKDAPIRLVLIFDTFEEALILGPDRVRLIADWIGLVGKQRLNPLVIVSGREASTLLRMPLPGLFLQGVLMLGDLTQAGGRALLRDQFATRGIEAADLVPKLVEAFGADPLTLMILARFAEGVRKEGGDVGKALTDLASGETSEARERLDGEMRQTFLMSRILNRLPSKELEALASPGLVLRQITPVLIREVLKPGLTLAEAEALFDKLDDMIWLVQRTSDTERVATHIPTLRRRMLPQLLQGEAGRAVLAAAIRWFEARDAAGEPGAGLEAMYYRALGDPETLPRDPVVLRQLADHIGSATADLGFAQDLFRAAQGGVVSQDTVEALGAGAARSGARAKRRKYQLSEGLESSVVAEAEQAVEIAGEAGREETEAMSADLVSARFAALELAAVAAEAPRLVNELISVLSAGYVELIKTSQPMTSEDLQGLSAAALQAATACLAPEVGPGPRVALQASVQDCLADPEMRELLVDRYASLIQQSPQLWPARQMLVIVLSLAAPDALRGLGETVVEAVRGMARASHSPYCWRALRVTGPFRDGDAVKGTALAYLATEVLPLVASSVIQTEDSAAQTEESDVAQAFRTILNGQGQVSISDHNRIEAILYRQDVTLQDKMPLLARLPGSVPGRLPEFHGAFRLILGTGDVPAAAMQEAVSSVARFVPWWPVELRADAFAEVPFSPTLISSLIDTADRCGRLPDLAAALATHHDAPPACARLSALIDATVAHYRAVAGVGTGP